MTVPPCILCQLTRDLDDELRRVFIRNIPPAPADIVHHVGSLALTLDLAGGHDGTDRTDTPDGPTQG